MKFLLRLLTFSFVLLLFVPLSAQNDQNWVVKGEGEKVQVQQNKSWVTVNSKNITEQLLTKTEKLMQLQAEFVKIQRQMEVETKSIKSFKDLKGLVEAEELSIKQKAKDLAANPPTKKEAKKAAKAAKSAGKKD